MVKFGEKYGLDKDRLKVEKGEEFSIVKIGKITKTRKEGEDYEIAEFDVIIEGKPAKRYGTNSAIVDACKTMLQDAKPDGTLKESIEVSVVERISEKRKKPYLAFE